MGERGDCAESVGTREPRPPEGDAGDWHGAMPHRAPANADAAVFDAGDRAASRCRDFGGLCGGVAFGKRRFTCPFLDRRCWLAA